MELVLHVWNLGHNETEEKTEIQLDGCGHMVYKSLDL